MTTSTTEPASPTRPYGPSWVNLVIAWFESLPGPTWVAYAPWGVLPARTNGGIRAPGLGQERARPSSQATGGVIGPLFPLLLCAFGRAPGHPVVAGRPRPWGFGPLVLL